MNVESQDQGWLSYLEYSHTLFLVDTTCDCAVSSSPMLGNTTAASLDYKVYVFSDVVGAVTKATNRTCVWILLTTIES